MVSESIVNSISKQLEAETSELGAIVRKALGLEPLGLSTEVELLEGDQR